MNRAERVEGGVLVLILITVGGLAGAASFTHVHDWTMDNSPVGTGDWFGWANAAISELIPLAALLTIRRRRRTGGSIRYPMLLLVSAVALSLAAQLAVAKPGLSGWLLSAVPALAFLGLSKLVLTVPPAPDAGKVQQPAPVEAEDGLTVDLIRSARQVAAEHEAATGRPITRDELRSGLRVADGTASELLRQIRPHDSTRRALVPVTGFPSRIGPAGVQEVGQ